MKNWPHIFSRITGICLILAVVFGPLAFGSVESWAYSILALLAFTALAASLIHDVQTDRASAFFSPVVAVGCAGMLLVIVQLVPWPAELLARIQPESLFVHRLEEEIVGRPLPSHISPSLYSYATRISLLKLGAYLALFAAAYSYITSRRRLTRLTVAVVATGFVASMFGLLQNLGGVGEIYWLRSISSGSPFGPFVSRNQFAAYGAIAFFAGFGLLLARGGGISDWFRGKNGKRKLQPSDPWKNMLLGFAVSITGVAVVWSLSRGGILAFALAGAATVVAMSLGGRAAGRRAYLPAVVLVVLGFLTWLGWTPVVERLQTLGIIVSEPAAIDRARYTMWGDAWNMGLRFPVLGTGAGTFASAYPAFSTLWFRALVLNPHSEYMGFFAETGFTGMALILLALGFLLIRILRGLRVRKNPYLLPFLAGGVGIIFSVAVHSFVDFPLRSPGIVATLAVVLGMIYRTAVMNSKHIPPRRHADAASSSVREGESGSNRLRTAGRDREKGAVFLKGLLTAMIFLGWIFACNVPLRELNAHIEKVRIVRAGRQLTPDTRNVSEFIEASRRAIESYSPGNAALYDRLAEFTRKAADTVEEPARRMMLAEKALEVQQTAVGLEPVNADHRINLAIDYLALGRPDLAWLHSRLAAEILAEDPRVRVEVAEMFLSAGFEEPAVEMLAEAEELARRRELESVQRSIERIRSRL